MDNIGNTEHALTFAALRVHYYTGRSCLISGEGRNKVFGYRELSVQWSALLMRTWGQCNQVPSLGHPFTVCGTSFRRI